jgi:RNA polymerase sigma-70 factor (family 1)
MHEQANYTKDQLLDGLRNGNESCFTTVFNNLYPALCYYAFQITGNQAAAEDIAEESFIKIWQLRGQFSEYNFLKSFLYKTVRNACIDLLRRQNRKRLQQNNIAGATEANDKTALEKIIQAEVFRELYHTLEHLPMQSRKVVSKFYIEGKSLKQIAKEMDLGIGTVKAHKKRGLVFLKNRLTTLFLFFC